MKVTVRVRFGGRLVPAAVFDVPEALATDDVLERTFGALNAPDPAGFFTLTPEVIAGYHRHFPSLSMGDTVEVGNRGVFVCEAVGWRPQYEPPDDNPDAGTEAAIEKANDFAAWRADPHGQL
jgi:hypothetical protein